MLSVPEIHTLSPLLSAAAFDPRDPRAAAAEFDAMVWQLWLQSSGLLRPPAAADEAHLPVISEMFVHVFARELARQIELGFGNLVLRQAQRFKEGEQP